MQLITIYWVGNSWFIEVMEERTELIFLLLEYSLNVPGKPIATGCLSVRPTMFINIVFLG